MISISLKDIQKTFINKEKKLILFDNLSLKLTRKKIYCLFGPSGCGKTTLLNIMVGLLSPDKGDVDITNNRDNERLKIAYAFQEDRLLPWKNIRQNLELVLDSKSYSKSQISRLIKKYLKLVRLPGSESKLTRQLSGGEKQRVALARALCINPQIILMDEPFSHLDELTATNLRKDLLLIQKKNPKMIIFVTHSPLEAIFLADEIIVLGNKKPTRIKKKVKINFKKSSKINFYKDSLFLKKATQVIKKILD